MASLAEIVDFLDRELRTGEVPDYPGALNGLQMQNNGTVTHVAAAVDYSSATVRIAAERRADLLLVHHGMFWSGAAPIVGAAYDRTAMLVKSNVAVYGSHIPVDLHPTWGNNVLLARELGLTPSAGFAMLRGVAVGVSGESDVATEQLRERAESLARRFGGTLVTTPIREGQRTRRWGICTGAGASTDTLKEAIELKLDTLVVGEGPHHTAVNAMDAGITILYAGHYATETLGISAVAHEVARRFSITSSFIDVPTGL